MSDAPPTHSRDPLVRQVRHRHVLGLSLVGLLWAGAGAWLLVGSPGEVSSAELAAAVVMLLSGVPLAVLPTLTNRHVRRGHARRVAELAEARRRAPAMSPIGSADGRCRVMGRVHLLAGACGVDRDVAARVTRTLSRGLEHSPTPKDGPTKVTDLTETRSCGRFAVIDDSGVAVVDPDDFEVLSRVPVDPFEPVTASARHGDMVEIIGTARPVPADDDAVDDVADLLGQRGYRDGKRTVLLFDGHADPVLIVARRRD